VANPKRCPASSLVGAGAHCDGPGAIGHARGRRLFCHGRVHRTSVLGLFVLGGGGRDVVAPDGSACPSALQGAALPAVASGILRGLCMAHLFQRELCHQPKSHPRVGLVDCNDLNARSSSGSNV